MTGEDRDRITGVVFDVYGTLLDTALAVEPARERLGERVARLAEAWRRKQLEYTWLLSLMRAHRDFDSVTADALDWALGSLGAADPALRAALLDGYRRLPAFPETAAALAALERAGLQLAVLSNGTPAMLEAGLAAAGLRPRFAHVLSIEAAGVYKPAAEVYRLATAALAQPAGRLAFVSANPWDAHAAAWNGFRAIRVDRTGLPDDPLPGTPAHLVRSLAELPGLLAA